MTHYEPARAPSFIVLSVCLNLCVAAFSQPALAWGDRGHQIVAQIAEDSVKSSTRDWIRGILGLEPLSVASTFPDHVRSDARFSHYETDELKRENDTHDFSEFHYCEIPNGSNYDSKTKKYVKDCFSSMTGAIEILKAPPRLKESARKQSAASAVGATSVNGSANDPDAQKQLVEKQIALRYLAHIVGDIANPFHVGNGFDRGGNYCRVRWTASRKAKDTNLHAAWDESLVDYLGQTFADPKKNRKAAVYLGDYMTTFRERHIDLMNAAGKVKLGGGDLKSWLMDSQALRESGVYPDHAVGASTDLSGVTPGQEHTRRKYCAQDGNARATLDLAYAEKFAPLIETQLLKSGLRLASVLDSIADTAYAARAKPQTLSDKDQEEILSNVQSKFKNKK